MNNHSLWHSFCSYDFPRLRKCKISERGKSETDFGHKIKKINEKPDKLWKQLN